MIQDSQCNRVYLSALMPMVCPQTFNNLSQVFDEYQVEWACLDGTKDIWCRDFMPVQVEKDKFAIFDYSPDYLRNFKKYSGKITDGRSILSNLGYQSSDSILDIVLDGGNVVRCGRKVIMTAKVFEENPSIRPYLLLKKLETIFETDIIVLPWDTKEIFGHADGICRYVDNDTILLTDYDAKNRKRFYDCLKPHFKNIVELTYKSSHKYSWSYINWLQTDKLIIVPSFGNDTDAEALEQIKQVMPSYEGKIAQCNCEDLTVYGGALNCCSWTVMN